MRILLSVVSLALLAGTSRAEEPSWPEVVLIPVAEKLQIALAPAVHFFVATIEEAPRASKLRAAYYIALGQLTLVTRARAAVASEDVALRARLEPLLAPHARTAWDYFRMLGSVGKHDAVLARDPVIKSMIGTSRMYAGALEQAWHFSAQWSMAE